MRASLVCALVGAAVLAAAQDRPTRAKPSDYPASSELPNIWLAADENGHSIMADNGSYEARDYLVIDVAVFSKDKTPVALRPGEFALRINGKNPTLTDSAGAVAASIKYDTWSSRPRLMTEAGVGDATIGTGYPRREGRFPGDPSGQVNLPRAPRVDTNNPNKPAEEPVSIEDLVQRATLPEGQHVAPYSGLLYFPYKGKLSKIKSLDLLYEGPYGKATLKLR